MCLTKLVLGLAEKMGLGTMTPHWMTSCVLYRLYSPVCDALPLGSPFGIKRRLIGACFYIYLTLSLSFYSFFFFKKNQYDYGNDDRLGDGNGERGGADTLDVIDMNLLARDDG